MVSVASKSTKEVNLLLVLLLPSLNLLPYQMIPIPPALLKKMLIIINCPGPQIPYPACKLDSLPEPIPIEPIPIYLGIYPEWMDVRVF